MDLGEAMTGISRRGFLFGSAAVAGTMAGCRIVGAGDGVDPCLTAFLSDIHVSGPDVQGQPTYQNPLFERTVDAVLAMRPLPARVVVMGDIALWKGRHEDYEASLPAFERIKAAGIALHLTMGNHDHRDVFLKYHPEYAKTSPVPGRIVSVVDLGTADLLLLDSLKETGAGEGENNAVEGALDDAQWAWLEAEVGRRTRPFFVGAHHAPNDLGGRKMRKLLASSKFAVGYIRGHDHGWSTDWMMTGWGARRIIRVACLPSTGWWGDIGFATLRTFADRAELAMAPGNDFFFPNPLKPGEARPAVWDEIRAEHANARCTFTY